MPTPLFINVCSTDNLIASFIVRQHAGLLSHYLPIHWVLEQTGRLFQFRGLLVMNTASVSVTSVSLSLLTGPRFWSVSCLCRVHEFQWRFVNIFKALQLSRLFKNQAACSVFLYEWRHAGNNFVIDSCALLYNNLHWNSISLLCILIDMIVTVRLLNI